MLEDTSQWMMILRTLGSLAAVLIVIYVLAVVTKKYLRPERWGSRSLGGSIQVVQTFAVGPKQKLLVVDVEEKRLLLGVGSESISQLAVLQENLKGDNSQTEEKRHVS